MVEDIVIGIATGLVSTYMYDKMKNRNSQPAAKSTPVREPNTTQPVETVKTSTPTEAASNLNFEEEIDATRETDAPPTQSETKPKTNWGLIVFSILPGFVIAGIASGILEHRGILSTTEAFSPMFYILVSLGSIFSFWVLSKFFK